MGKFTVKQEPGSFLRISPVQSKAGIANLNFSEGGVFRSSSWGPIEQASGMTKIPRVEIA